MDMDLDCICILLNWYRFRFRQLPNTIGFVAKALAKGLDICTEDSLGISDLGQCVDIAKIFECGENDSTLSTERFLCDRMHTAFGSFSLEMRVRKLDNVQSEWQND